MNKFAAVDNKEAPHTRLTREEMRRIGLPVQRARTPRHPRTQGEGRGEMLPTGTLDGHDRTAFCWRCVLALSPANDLNYDGKCITPEFPRYNILVYLYKPWPGGRQGRGSGRSTFSAGARR